MNDLGMRQEIMTREYMIHDLRRQIEDNRRAAAAASAMMMFVGALIGFAVGVWL